VLLELKEPQVLKVLKVIKELREQWDLKVQMLV
jgi:hypothetical protein